MRFQFSLCLALLMAWAPAQQGTDPDSGVEALDNFLLKSQTYQDQLETYSEVLKDKMADLRREVAIHQAAYEKGLVSQADLETIEEKLSETQRLQELQAQALVTVRQTVVEVKAAFQQMNHRQEDAEWVRFAGWRPWDLEQIQDLDGFFQRRFGRELPVSAYGQTDTHLLLGFDHKGRVDVAVHPRSPEGEALMVLLRELGLPFIAFDGPLEGSATGAHIHLGPPSPRVF